MPHTHMPHTYMPHAHATVFSSGLSHMIELPAVKFCGFLLSWYNIETDGPIFLTFPRFEINVWVLRSNPVLGIHPFIHHLANIDGEPWRWQNHRAGAAEATKFCHSHQTQEEEGGGLYGVVPSLGPKPEAMSSAPTVPLQRKWSHRESGEEKGWCF